MSHSRGRRFESDQGENDEREEITILCYTHYRIPQPIIAMPTSGGAHRPVHFARISRVPHDIVRRLGRERWTKGAGLMRGGRVRRKTPSWSV